MSRKLSSITLVVAMSVGLACAHYQSVNMPPQIDLTQFPVVGVVQFSSSSAHGALPRFATQRFIQQLTEAQPGIRILDLGAVQQALDADAIRALGTKANVQAIFAGSFEVNAPQTSFGLRGGFGISTEVTGTLTATLYDTAQGAMVWTQSAPSRATAGAGGVGAGGINVEIGGEENAYARIVSRSAFAITDAFRSHWVTQRID